MCRRTAAGVRLQHLGEGGGAHRALLDDELEDPLARGHLAVDEAVRSGHGQTSSPVSWGTAGVADQ